MNADPQGRADTQSSAEATVEQASRLALSEASRRVSDPALNEDQALALLRSRDLPAEILQALSKHVAVAKLRKVRLALVAHPNTPRHLSLRFLRQLYTFDLMQLALLPAIAADLKAVADQVLITRLSTITVGERCSLARRASAPVASALLNDVEPRVIKSALENPRLSEANILKALSRHDARAALVLAVCRHPKWSLRHEVRIALLQSDKTPLARALQFAQALPPHQLLDILHRSRLPEGNKAYLLRQASTAEPKLKARSARR